MIKLETLRCFLATAHGGSLAAAADTLGRTQSAVSMALKQLEAEIGAELFEPGRKDQLTPLGEHTLALASKSLEHFDQSVQSIRAFATSKTVHVSIAAVPSVAQVMLPSVVEDFMSRHPDVSVELRDMDSAAVLRELKLGTVDIGIASNVPETSDITREHLFSDAFGIVSHPNDNLGTPGKPLDWEDVKTRPFLANGLCQSIEDGEFRKLLGESRLMVLNTGSLLAMVRSRMGITLLPQLLTRRTDWDLKFDRVANKSLRRDLYVVRRAARALSQEANAMLETIFGFAGSF